jgi:Uma2 family endonuclease
MSAPTILRAKPEIEYPDSDGRPMSDNTLQFQWIVTLQGGLDALFRDDSLVFVAGDLLWYPVEGDNTVRVAPDVLVVFGRPKGYRGSYRQWEEDNLAPHVVFEILSPGNRAGELVRKFRFYEQFGVEEFYTYDPQDAALAGWIREGERFREIETMSGWVSPRLGVRFDLSSGELQVFRPDGRRLPTYVELAEQSDAALQAAELQRRRADEEHARADEEHARAQQERERAKRLAARLRELGVEPAE